MQPVSLQSVKFTDVVFLGKGLANDEFDVSEPACVAAGLRLWYLGNGVLVEAEGLPDKFINVALVRQMEAKEQVTPWQWAGVEREPKELKLLESILAALQPVLRGMVTEASSSKATPKPKPAPSSKKRAAGASAPSASPSSR